jgi:hypothetical protein
MNKDKVVKKSKIDILDEAIEQARIQFELARKEINLAKMQDMKFLITKLREIRNGN